MKTALFLIPFLLFSACSQDSESNEKNPYQGGSELVIRAEAESEAGADYDFGSVFSGTSKKISFLLVNDSPVALKLTSLVVSNPVFQLKANTCAAIEANTKCLVEIEYAPTASGSYTAEISASYAKQNASNTVKRNLKGTSKTRAALSFSPALVDFGEGALPANSSQTVVLQNTGETNAENLSFPTLASPFSWGTSTCESSLAAGQSCIANVVFQTNAVVHQGASSYLTYQNGVEQAQTAFSVNASTTNGSFNTAKGFDGAVLVLETNSSGNVFVGGSFTSFSSQRAGHLLKFKTDLLPDIFPVETGFDGEIYAIKSLSNGKSYVAGSFTSYNGVSVPHLVRLDATGVLDTSFDLGSGLDGSVYAVLVDANDKVVVGGEFTTVNGTVSPKLIRLNTDGSVDNTFTTGTGFTGAAVYALGVDSQSNIIAAGNFSNYNGDPVENLIRLTSNGLRDNTFDTTSAANGSVLSIIVESNDGMYLGGEFTAYKGASANRIIRLTNNANKEPLFNYGTGFNATVRTLAASNTDVDQIYVGGDFTRYQGTASNGIAKLESIGSIDVTFVASTGFNGSVYSIKKLSDDSILAGGNFQSYKSKGINRLAHISSLGSLISSFSENAGANQKVSAILPEEDGSLLVGGVFTRFGDSDSARAVKLDRHSVPITAFATGTGFDAQVNALIVSPFNASKFIFGGQFSQYNSQPAPKIIQLNADGSVDSSFSAGAGFNGSVNTCLNANSLVVCGGQFTTYKGTTVNGIARISSSGALDSSFVMGSGFNGTVWALAEDSSHRLYIGGDFTSYNGTPAKNIVRLLQDGTLDLSFNTGTGFDLPVWSIVIASNSGLFIGGDFTSYNGSSASGIIKVNTDGSVDSSFNAGAGFNGGVNAIALKTDGSLCATGSFTEYQSLSHNNIACISETGALVATFNSGTGFNGQGFTLKLATDGSGDLYVGGIFTSYNGVTTDSLVRLSSTGALE